MDVAGGRLREILVDLGKYLDYVTVEAPQPAYPPAPVPMSKVPDLHSAALDSRSNNGAQLDELYHVVRPIYPYWQFTTHSQAPRHVRAIVKTMMLLRVVPHYPNSILMAIPKEIMLEIFSYLPWYQ
jgi:hypothetical protein